MAFPGQPTPSTVTHNDRNPVSDGQSVKVTVLGPAVVNSDEFYLIDDFLGCAFESVTLDPGEQAELALNIAPAEYESNQTNPGLAYATGSLLYWDPVANIFTTDPVDNRLTGRVTVAKDANDVIWFILFPQGVDRVAEAHADSAAADVPGLVADYNGLLAKLRAAGILNV